MAEKVAACLEIENPTFAQQLQKHLPAIYKRGWVDILYLVVPSVEKDLDVSEEDYYPKFKTMKLRNDTKREQVLAKQSQEWIRKNELANMGHIKRRGIIWFIGCYFDNIMNDLADSELEPFSCELFHRMGLARDAAERLAKSFSEWDSQLKYQLPVSDVIMDWFEPFLCYTPVTNFCEQTQFHEDEPFL